MNRKHKDNPKLRQVITGKVLQKFLEKQTDLNKVIELTEGKY